MVKYSNNFRLAGSGPVLIDIFYISNDDGDWKINPVLISNRLEWISELVAKSNNFGFRGSGIGWLETVYISHNEIYLPFTFSGAGDYDEITHDTLGYHGFDVELFDAFFLVTGKLDAWLTLQRYMIK